MLAQAIVDTALQQPDQTAPKSDPEDKQPLIASRVGTPTMTRAAMTPARTRSAFVQPRHGTY